MTKMKQRAFSFVVLVAMICTLFCGIGVTAEETQGTASIITAQEEELLLHLGILKTPGPHLEAETTRGGVAQIASRVAKLPEYTGEENYFTDVPTSHRYYKEIQALAAAGILNGDGNGKFRPDEPMTGPELCKIYSVIVGYDLVGQYETFPAVANRIGLTQGIEFTGNVTVGQMLRMALNALDTDMMEKVAYGSKDNYRVQNGFTALERYFGLVKQRGIVTGVEGTRLTDADISINKGQIIIDGKTFHYDDTEDLLGREVVFYSKRDKSTGGTQKKIEFLYEDAERNHYLVLDGSDVVGFQDNYFAYFDKSKEKKVQMTGAPDVILNGIAYSEYTPAELKPDCGTVTLLDNNDDYIYDVVIIEEYLFTMVESIDQETGILRGKNPYLVVGDEKQEEIYQVYMEAGITGELAYLSPGDMVAIQASRNTRGRRKITVHYLGEGTSGVIEGIYKDTYTISGVPYKVTGATAMDKDPYLLGQTVSVYTHEGLCAGLIHPNNDNYKFGYMVDAKVDETAFSGTLKTRIVTQEREMLELTATKKFMLDESEYNDHFRALAQIKAAADKRIPSPDMQDALDATALGQITRTDLKQLFSYGVLPQYKEGEENFPYSQPVRYRLNNEGELTHLDTLIKGENETENSLTPLESDGGTEFAETEGAMYSSQDRGFYIYDGSGSVFASLVSTGNIIRPPFDQRDKVEFYGNASITNESYCAVEAYTANEYRVARYAVVYNQVRSSVFSENQIYLVGDLEKTLDAEGDVVRQVTLYGYGGPYTRVLTKDVPDSAVTVGNVVRYEMNTDNEVTVVEVFYNIADGDPIPAQRVKETGQSRAWGSRCRMAYGTALAYGDQFITHTTSIGEDIYKKEGLRNYLASSASFYKYTNKGGEAKVELAGAGDLVPYDVDSKTTQKVIMITYNNRLDVVYIIDKD